jgi:hypothetical protein
MGLAARMKARTRKARDPDSLELLEQIMEHEDSTRNQEIFKEPDWLRIASIFVVILVAL